MRYAQNVARVLSIPTESVALLATLMLRGPQTPGEIRINCERLHRFADISSVEAYLRELAERPAGALVPRCLACRDRARRAGRICSRACRSCAKGPLLRRLRPPMRSASAKSRRCAKDVEGLGREVGRAQGDAHGRSMRQSARIRCRGRNFARRRGLRARLRDWTTGGERWDYSMDCSARCLAAWRPGRARHARSRRPGAGLGGMIRAGGLAVAPAGPGPGGGSADGASRRSSRIGAPVAAAKRRHRGRARQAAAERLRPAGELVGRHRRERADRCGRDFRHVRTR